VVYRGAHERQAQRDVHASAEARVLEHRQTLVVVHREHRVRLLEAVRHEQRVGRHRPERIDAGLSRRLDRRRDHLGILAPEVPGFPAVRIESGDQDSRLGDAEALVQVVMHDA
jgi:hypothetical protein